MAKRRSGTRTGAQAPAGAKARRSARGGGRNGRWLLGLLVGAALVLLAGYAYLHRAAWTRTLHGETKPSPATHRGEPPTRPGATRAKPEPGATVRHPAVPAAGASPVKPPEVAPFGSSEDVFEAGAEVYRRQCARCHGTPRVQARAASPTGAGAGALDLWHPHTAHDRRIGVTGQPVAQIYNSIAQSPTPGHAFRQKLSGTEIWQVTLLIEHAGDPDGLPDPVRRILDSSTSRSDTSTSRSDSSTSRSDLSTSRSGSSTGTPAR